MEYLEIKASICWKEQSTAGRSASAPRYGLTQESAEKYRRENKIRTLMRMRIMESDGDVMLKTCRGPNSEEALSIAMMLLRGMTNCYTSVKQGGQTGVLFSVRHQRKGIWHESEARWLPIRTLFATLP